ncbi:MAG: helix-turn-helix domain-containing protein [Lachnospiraceae bacterium]|nr:helix-turn-helix domain-containing protein [Lachnospiraceae bacterium]
MLCERLRQLTNEKGWSLQQLAEISDLPLETVRNIYYGKTPDPKISTVMKLAKSFNLTVNCLMGQCSHTPQERAILINYRNCGKHGKSIIELISRYEACAMKKEREKDGRHKIPCIVPEGTVSHGIIYDMCETVEIETDVKEAYIAIRMVSNDLAPTYCKGDILLFENRFPKHGEKAAFYKGDRIYIRRYLEEENQYCLKCLHNCDVDIILKRMDEVDYIGTCVDVVRD